MVIVFIYLAPNVWPPQRLRRIKSLKLMNKPQLRTLPTYPTHGWDQTAWCPFDKTRS